MRIAWQKVRLAAGRSSWALPIRRPSTRVCYGVYVGPAPFRSRHPPRRNLVRPLAGPPCARSGGSDYRRCACHHREQFVRATGRPRSRDEFQQLSETLNEMLERIEQSFMRTKQFTADASHELRAPHDVDLYGCAVRAPAATSHEELVDSLERFSANRGGRPR